MAVAGVFHGAGTTAAAAGGLASFLLFYKMYHDGRNYRCKYNYRDYVSDVFAYPIRHGQFLLLTYYIISFFLYGFALSFAASL